MKKLLLLLILFVLLQRPALAATPTPDEAEPTISSSQKNETLVNQINQLKDKIASRVAQLKLVEKRGVIGTVTEVSDNRLTLKDNHDDIKIVDVDDITKFSSPSAKSAFGISDVTKGMNLSVIGLYNKESKHILARYITSFTMPIFTRGTVTEVNKEDFTLSISSKDNTTTIIDVETTTKLNTYEDATITRLGFTKVVVGDRVEIVGYPSKADPSRITGSYILVINDLTSTKTP